MPTLRPFYLLSLLAVATLGCQRDQPKRTEQRSPALADSLALDSVVEPVAVTPVRRDWHHLERLTNRKAPLVVYRRGVVRPSSFNMAAPPVEARLQDLTLKASEYFQIDPSRPAEVQGREGTIIRIPAKALLDARQRPATGTVWVEVKECYSVADLLLSNLLTETTTGTPLELAGAVLVRATAGGQQLALATSQEMQVQLASAPQPQLYYGDAVGTSAPLRWKAAEAAATAAEKVYSSVEQMPQYGDGPEDINKLIRYPSQAMSHQTQGIVFASFVVDETGRVANPRIIKGLGDGCDEEVLRVLRQTSGRWQPGKQEGQAVKVRLTLPIRFAFEQGAGSAVEAHGLAASDPTEPEFAKVPNGMWVRRLGWIATGKAWTGATTAYYVPVPAAAEQTALRMVLPGRRVVLAGMPQTGGYQFLAAPARAKIVLLGMRYENGAPFVARQEARTSIPPDSLQFAETSLGELEATLATFN
ncbi:energy transducer TonB [Hymenobacter taeanensis]|uniref:Energy transducer TonB n=1 Tax=Hymenobacter taeanensis TaxID=2735321 RepID=A0A6M6BI00_9BACT|nr:MULTISPECIES: energy transducer TonB [Hymenobacter]QJX46923.1 energy transducer TonB [Hymenobacter taeanensis]UOQ80798.1 energy transducer TonB [Hymenobacter sp. 5414T-23]